MQPDQHAVALYAILARDVCDFLDMLPEASDDTLETLHAMLTLPNDEHDTSTRRLNSDGAEFVASAIKKRNSAHASR